MKTAAEFKAWLGQNDSIPVLLIKAYANVSGTETLFKMSVGHFPDYLPIVSIGVEYVEQLGLNGSNGSLSYGDLKIDNTNGERDDWLNYVWSNRVVEQYVGDASWNEDDFQLVFKGYSASDLDSEDSETLNLKLMDRFQNLNNPISDTKLGGSSTNKNVLIPTGFGEIFNATPILSNPATQEYQVHGSAIEQHNEVLTDAKLRTAVTSDVSTGKFTFNTAVGNGVVTCTFQGDKFGGTYRKTIASVIQRIVTGYGKAVDRLTSADIDTANFAAFESANTQTIGYYSTARENILPICQFLAGSVGAQMVPSRTGLLRLIKIELPAPGTPRVITRSQMFEKGGDIHISDRPKVQPTWILGFNKNWTPQPTLTTGVPVEIKEMLAQEWLTVKADDSTARTLYKTSEEPPQKDTALVIESEAQTEANRLRDLWKVARKVYDFTGTSDLLDLQLGDPVTLVHSRFNMSAGKDGMVIKLKPNWLKREISVGVLV